MPLLEIAHHCPCLRLLTTAPICNHTPMKEHWSSKLSFILAATGAAVGLGNIWKFPYMAGDNGGSAFLLVYLIAVLVIGLPVMMAEMLIGRLGRCNAITSMARLARDSGACAGWSLVGWWGALTLVLVLAFYSVVSGWSLSYLYFAMMDSFHQLRPDQIGVLWVHYLGSPGQLLVAHSVFMMMTMCVVSFGVRRGIERAAQIMMPGLFGILVLLVGYALTTSGFSEGWNFLFAFHLEKITMGVIISAMGHAFFTLAIGAGCMLTYGAYLPAETKIGQTVFVIAGLDVLVALLAGLSIFPLIFTDHLAPNSGPGLMFQALPIIFAKLPGGHWIGTLFFALLLFAAWTSSMSMAEPLVALLSERFKLTRRCAAVVVGAIAWGFGLAALLSFNLLSNIHIFGRWSIFTAMTDLVTNIMLPIGGIAYALFAGWSLPTQLAAEGLNISSHWALALWQWLVRYLAPVAILVIMICAVVGADG